MRGVTVDGGNLGPWVVQDFLHPQYKRLGSVTLELVKAAYGFWVVAKSFIRVLWVAFKTRAKVLSNRPRVKSKANFCGMSTTIGLEGNVGGFPKLGVPFWGPP